MEKPQGSVKLLFRANIFVPIHVSSIFWKHLKTVSIADVFRGYKKGALGINGLKNSFNNSLYRFFNPVQDGLFGGFSRMGLLPKFCHTCPTMMKLGTVIPYPKKIQKIYESRDTPLEFSWHQYFFTRNQKILLYQEIQI